jgi:hypothetical protein
MNAIDYSGREKYKRYRRAYMQKGMGGIWLMI